MEEMEWLKRAKMYMDKLAQGIDPITGIQLPCDTVLNNVRLSRCFFYVAGVLGRLIDAGGEEALAQGKGATQKEQAAKRRVRFHVTKEQAASVGVESTPIEMSALCKKLNALIDERQMRKLMVVKVTNWLLREGYLQEKLSESGRNVRLPSEQGRQLGISSEVIYSYKMKYAENAQWFVLDHIEEITRPSERTWDWGSWQGKPAWGGEEGRAAGMSWSWEVSAASMADKAAASFAKTERKTAGQDVAAWKAITEDAGCAKGGVAHSPTESTRVGSIQSSTEHTVPKNGYTDTATAHTGEHKGAAATLARSTALSDGVSGSRDKLWLAAQDVLD